MEDSTTNYSTIIISVLMAVVIIATVMIPIITATTQTATTTEIDNKGAGWLKLGYSSGNDFDFEITNENSNISIGDQTGTMGDNIYYADSKNVIFADSVQNAIFLLNTESSSVHKFSNTVSVENTEGTLNISDGTETVVSSESPTWAYIPDTAGEYGFFANGGLILKDEKPTVAVGSYAGVFAYNETVVAPYGYGNLGLTMSGNYADNEVIWSVSSSESDSLNLDSTDSLEPTSIQPTNLGGAGSVGLMAVTPGAYTYGDWTFNVSSGNATIISNTGTNLDTVNIPAVVSSGGVNYPVTTIGSPTAAFGESIITDEQLNDGASLIIPDSVTKINNNAFCQVTKIGGTIIIPDSVTSIGINTFNGVGMSELIISSSLTTIPNSMCYNCTNLASVKLPASVTTIRNGAFSGCTNLTGTLVIPGENVNLEYSCYKNVNYTSLILLGDITVTYESGSVPLPLGTKEILNLGSTELTTTSYGLNADSIQDYVTALGYIAPVSIHETVIVEDTSLSATLLKLLPVFMALVVVIFIAYAMYRPDSEFIQSLKNKL